MKALDFKIIIPFIYFISLFVLFQSGMCQTAIDYVPASPEATEFEKAYTYPTDHYTGTPAIKIPLYTITERDI
jgi:hypothetical protein